DRADHHLKRGNGTGPDNALVIVALFDGGRRNPADSNAVTTHLNHSGFAIFVQVSGAQRFGVGVAQEKHVTNFDPSLNRKGAAGRIRIAFDHIADIVDGGFGQVTTPVDAG